MRIAEYVGCNTLEGMYLKLGVDTWRTRVPVQQVREYQMELSRHTYWATIGGFNGNIINDFFDLEGKEDALCMIKTDRTLARAIIRDITDDWCRYLEYLLSSGWTFITMVENSSDFGSQRGMLISPDDFRYLFKPQLKRLVRIAHKHGVLYMQHSCGGIEPIIEDFIEIGVDVLNPIQVTAKGMDIELLSKKYKNRIAFCGGIDTQHLMREGSTGDVRKAVRRLKKIFGDTGLIVGGTHEMGVDVPIENAMAMITESVK